MDNLTALNIAHHLIWEERERVWKQIAAYYKKRPKPYTRPALRTLQRRYDYLSHAADMLMELINQQS